MSTFENIKKNAATKEEFQQYNTRFRKIIDYTSRMGEDEIGELAIQKTISPEKRQAFINVTIQQSIVNGVIDRVLLEMYSKINIVLLFTDLVFDGTSDANSISDFYVFINNQTNIFDSVCEVAEDDINFIIKTLDATVTERLEYGRSAASILNTFVTDLPKNIAAAKEMVDSFDKDKYTEVIAFAEAANGNRPIKGSN